MSTGVDVKVKCDVLGKLKRLQNVARRVRRHGVNVDERFTPLCVRQHLAKQDLHVLSGNEEDGDKEKPEEC